MALCIDERAEVWRLMREYLERQDQVLRDLLGLWVSEIEPQLIYAPAMLGVQLKGIGFADTVIFESPDYKPYTPLSELIRKDHDHSPSLRFALTR